MPEHDNNNSTPRPGAGECAALEPGLFAVAPLGLGLLGCPRGTLPAYSDDSDHPFQGKATSSTRSTDHEDRTNRHRHHRVRQARWRIETRSCTPQGRPDSLTTYGKREHEDSDRHQGRTIGHRHRGMSLRHVAQHSSWHSPVETHPRGSVLRADTLPCWPTSELRLPWGASQIKVFRDIDYIPNEELQACRRLDANGLSRKHP